jgi:hypothetical protein
MEHLPVLCESLDSQLDTCDMRLGAIAWFIKGFFCYVFIDNQI